MRNSAQKKPLVTPTYTNKGLEASAQVKHKKGDTPLKLKKDAYKNIP